MQNGFPSPINNKKENKKIKEDFSKRKSKLRKDPKENNRKITKKLRQNIIEKQRELENYIYKSAIKENIMKK